MPYVFSMTARMATIAACCVLLLCVLLFLLGVEIGARYAAPASASVPGAAVRSEEHTPLPTSPDAAASVTQASSAS